MEFLIQTIAQLIGGIAGTLIGHLLKLLLMLLMWFVFWGSILERLVSKAGFSGAAYRWLMGIPTITFLPPAVVLAWSNQQPNEALSALHFIANGITLLYLAWAPWSVRQKK
jgi:hypothetical protein